jgi:hypothetical protein
MGKLNLYKFSMIQSEYRMKFSTVCFIPKMNSCSYNDRQTQRQIYIDVILLQF